MRFFVNFVGEEQITLISILGDVVHTTKPEFGVVLVQKRAGSKRLTFRHQQTIDISLSILNGEGCRGCHSIGHHLLLGNHWLAASLTFHMVETVDLVVEGC